ncbi:MAG: hypothetical protein B6244_03740 [Candidatus Cloacimonetes bacterium 4572_55]|nr:MAG: hypothetical protein B6244_03740 [Candidatus Cloacimonetes bacterium 4572_55]
MKKAMIFYLLILFVSLSVASAKVLIKKDFPERAVIDLPVKPANIAVPYSGDTPHVSESPGEIVGRTFYDGQHNSAIGHMIAAMPNGDVYVTWMDGDNADQQPREVKYRYRNAESGEWAGDDDGVTWGVNRSGYTMIDLKSGGEAVATFHYGTPTRSQVAQELYPGYSLFQVVDTDMQSYSAEEIIWPKIAVDGNDIVHVLAANYVAAAEDNNNIYYSQSNTDDYLAGGMGNWEFIQGTEERLQVLSYSIDASLVSPKVARTFLLSPSYDPTVANQRENDVYIQISEDGGNSWGDMTNITNYNEIVNNDIGYLEQLPEPYDFWDPASHPTVGEIDEFWMQAYSNVEVFIDPSDVTHLIWTTTLIATRNDTTLAHCYMGNIYHWDDSTEEIHLVYDNIHDNPLWNDVDDPNDFFDRLGAFDNSVCDPTIGADENGNLFMSFIQFFAGDYCAEIDGYGNDNSGLMYNGEVMMIMSTDGGATWGSGDGDGVAVNVTNSPTPNCQVGECDDDGYPSIAERVTNGTIHLFYLNDDTAGFTIQDEGPASNSPMKYFPVPVGDITNDIEDENPGHVAEKSAFLHQNMPNPFSAQTAIHYQLESSSQVSLSVYNQTGQLVKVLENGSKSVGDHEAMWDGTNENGDKVGVGVYFYQLQTDNRTETKKMTLLR